VLACITNHFPLLTWHRDYTRLHIHWPSHSHTREGNTRTYPHHMYVHERAHTCTQNCSDRTKEHTHILSGALLTAQPRAHKLSHTHTHTPSLLHISKLLQFTS